MKKLIMVLLFLSFQLVFSQVHKFNAYSVAFYNAKTEEWDAPEDARILISINLESQKIKIYSKEIQTFDIIRAYEKTVDNEGDETLRFYCEDHNASTCYVDFVILNSRGGAGQFYIRYDNLTYLYNVKPSE